MQKCTDRRLQGEGDVNYNLNGKRGEWKKYFERALGHINLLHQKSDNNENLIKYIELI